MGKDMPLSRKDLQDLKDILLSEPFKPEGITYTLKFIKSKYAERVDPRDPESVREDCKVIVPYEMQLNEALGSRVLSDTTLQSSDGTTLYIERDLHIGIEALLLARARRLAQNASFQDRLALRVRERFGWFSADCHLRKDLCQRLEKYDLARDGVFRGKNSDGDETLWMPLLSVVYENGRFQEQDSYSTLFP